MQRVKYILWIFLLCPLSWAQFPLPIPVQSKAIPLSAGTCTTALNVTAGHTETVMAHSEGLLTTPTSLRGETWTLIDSDTASSVKTYAWIGVAVSTGAQTITLTGSLAFAGCTIVDWPASIGSTIGGHTHGSYSGSPLTITAGPITTTKNGAVVIGYASGFRSGGTLESDTFLDMENGSDSSGAGFIVAGTNGSYSITFNNGLGNNDVGGWVVFSIDPQAISILSSILPDAGLGTAYEAKIHTVGGVGAYTYSIVSSGLPTGLSLNSSTGEITGTPSGGGTTPTFQVTDGTNTTTRAISIVVNTSTGTVAPANSSCVAISTVVLNVTAGQLQLVSEYMLSGVAIATPSDDVGTVYHFARAMGSPQTAGGLMKQVVYMGIAPSSSATNHITVYGTQTCAIAYTDGQILIDNPASTSGNDPAPHTITGPGITTVVPNEFAYAVAIGDTSGGTITAVAPFTLEVSTNTGAMQGVGDKAVAAASTVTPQFTLSGADSWSIIGFAIRPTSSVPFVASNGVNWSDVF